MPLSQPGILRFSVFKCLANGIQLIFGRTGVRFQTPNSSILMFSALCCTVEKVFSLNIGYFFSPRGIVISLCQS
jgi:hypothetical protein